MLIYNLFNIASHPEVQDELREEVNGVVRREDGKGVICGVQSKWTNSYSVRVANVGSIWKWKRANQS